jgi:hypothetical protein
MMPSADLSATVNVSSSARTVLVVEAALEARIDGFAGLLVDDQAHRDPAGGADGRAVVGLQRYSSSSLSAAELMQ